MLKWHHGDGRTPLLPVTDRLVGASSNMKRTGLLVSQFVAIRLSPNPCRTREFIRSPPDSIRTFVLASGDHAHWSRVSKKGTDKGVADPVSARGRRAGQKPCYAQFSQFPHFSCKSFSLFPAFHLACPSPYRLPPTGASRQRGVSATLFPPGFSVVSGCRPESIAPYQGSIVHSSPDMFVSARLARYETRPWLMET